MPTPTPIAGDNGASLHISRRLDWRFLLPDPSLETVAYVGPGDSSMAIALRAFTRSVVAVDPSRLGDALHQSRYDIVVVDSSATQVIERSRSALKAGGWLYAEFERRPWRGTAPGAAVRRARAAGFHDVSTQWHWPTFEACTRIVSLDEPTPFVFSLARGMHGLVPNVKTAIGRTLVSSGLLGQTVSCFSIVARA